VVVAVGVSSCGFSVDGSGESSAGETGTASTATDAAGSTSITTDTTTGPPGETSASEGTTTTAASSGATAPDATGTGAGPGEPLLVFAEAPTHDYGEITLGQAGVHTFALSNNGDADATDLVPVELPAPFAYVGGNYPGTGGTCGTTLARDEACTIDVEVTSDALGPSTTELTVDYGPGAWVASVELVATRIGATGNLLVNGDGETISDPPTGWTELSGDRWECGTDDVGPRTGSGHIHPDSSGGVNLLAQDVDLTPHATAIATGELSIAFSGWARSWDSEEDPYRFEVQYLLGGDRNPLEAFDTGQQLGSTWTEYTDTRNAPVGTTRVRLLLECERIAGSVCGGYFDDMVITATYDPRIRTTASRRYTESRAAPRRPP
jgi:hypothetical protein